MVVNDVNTNSVVFHNLIIIKTRIKKDYAGILITLLCTTIILIPGWISFDLDKDMVTLLAATAVMLAAAILLLFHLRNNLIFSKSEIFFLAFLATILLLSFFSTYPIATVLYRVGLVFCVFIVLKSLGRFTEIRFLALVFVAAGIIEVLYAIINYKTSDIGISGHFDNPAGFSVTIVALVPFAVYLIAIKNLAIRVVGILAILVFLTGLFMSGSRAAIIAMSILGLIYLTRYTYPYFCRLYPIYKCLILLLIAAIFVSGAACLYFYKKDSADGRLLIWKSSWQMVAEKPMFGHGANSFKAKYMLAQASYFEQYPESRFADLADNVKHPFNEYLSFLVQYGWIGSTILALLLFSALRNGLIPLTESKITALLSLIGIAIFGLFSYPLYYPLILVLLGVIFSIITKKETENERNVKIKCWGLLMFLLPVICLLFINSIKTIRCEKAWSGLKHTFNFNQNTDFIIKQYGDLYLEEKFDNVWFLYNYGAVLNRCGKYHESICVLKSCSQQMNDSDLQVLIADNYLKIGKYQQAEIHATLASRMCPNRFIPLYQLVLIYSETERKNEAYKIATKILDKPMKITSQNVIIIKQKVKKIIQEKE